MGIGFGDEVGGCPAEEGGEDGHGCESTYGTGEYLKGGGWGEGMGGEIGEMVGMVGQSCACDDRVDDRAECVDV